MIVKTRNAWIAVVVGLASLAFAAPDTLVQSVTYDGETITMQLTKETLRGTNFVLWAQNTNGTYDVITPVAERSYLGTVDGYPDAVSCGILKDDGTFKGAVYFDRGVTWFTLGTAVVETRALDYGTFSNYQIPGSPTVSAGQAGTTMHGYEIGVDVDYDYFNTVSGGSVTTALEGIEYSVCLVRAIYMRDVLLRPYLGRVIVRSALAHDPYTGLTQGAYLGALNTEWETNHTNTNPDLVCGASPTKIGGGLAWVGVVGTGSGYSVNQCNGSGNFDVVFRHEMGHNWDCGHYVGGSPEGTGLMGGNAPGRFSGCEVYRVFNHRDSRAPGILDDEGTYTAIELPPYASMDVGEFVQTVTSSLSFDVLANDHDANGQVVSLFSYDSASANGGTVTQQGQDLVYTAPGAFLGADYFTYAITDSVGRVATGVVIVDVQPDDPLRLYLPLDETSGNEVTDQSVFANYAEFSGTNLTVASVTGKFANAVNFDGVDDHVWVSNVKLSTNTVTISAWIKPAASQNSFSGIVFDRSSSASGLNIHSDGKLRYHWNDSSSSYNWDSGLMPPLDTWSFVTLVIEPARAIMYMDSGSGLQSSTNNVAHAAATFGTTYVGRDPSGSRYFNGAIDDARIYNFAMSQAELQNVRDGGRAESPSPFDGATGVQSPEVSWAPGAVATSNAVYVGTSQAAVSIANTGSPEYQGSTADADWIFDLQPYTTYFWRIDSVTPSNTIPGMVWSFTTGGFIYEAGLVAHWKLDDGTGPTTVDSSLNNNVGTLNGTVWTNGFKNGGLSFDGVDDSVTFGSGPSLGGSTDFTVSAWIKTTAATEQVILQQRAGGGSGYNGVYVFKILPTGTLSFFIYADGGYQYNFGTAATVNDGQWHFVSAVRDGENGYLYIDGNPVPAASASGAIRNLNAGIGVGMGRNIRDYNSAFNGVIDEAKIYNLAKSGSELMGLYNSYFIASTNAPEWTTIPVNEITATANDVYGSTLTDNAFDLDNDPLTFSKVSGPAWLSVAPNGALSGTPSSGDVDPNSWVVEVTDGIEAPVQATLNIVVREGAVLVNPSFEDGPAETGVPIGWTLTGGSTDSLGVGTGGSHGSQLLWIGPHVEIIQDLNYTLLEAETLTLEYDSSRGANYARSIQLLAKNGETYQLMAETTQQTGSGAWPTIQMDYAVAAQYAGRQLAVRIIGDSWNDPDGDDWNELDNFRISSIGGIQPDNDSDGNPDAYDPDDDNDGMTDAWEHANGLDPLVDDSADHSDSDAYDNWHEYVTDTLPTNGASYQTFSVEIDPGTGEPTVRFSTSANRKYTVLYRDDLTSGTWLDLVDPKFSGDGTEMTVSDSAAVSNRYYRLRIELP